MKVCIAFGLSPPSRADKNSKNKLLFEALFQSQLKGNVTFTTHLKPWAAPHTKYRVGHAPASRTRDRATIMPTARARADKAREQERTCASRPPAAHATLEFTTIPAESVEPRRSPQPRQRAGRALVPMDARASSALCMCSIVARCAMPTTKIVS